MSTTETAKPDEVPGKRELLLTVDLPPLLATENFSVSDVFRLPEGPEDNLFILSIDPHRWPGWRTFVIYGLPEPVPFRATELFQPMRMNRIWSDVPCLVCKQTGQVHLEMVQHGRLKSRICRDCS
ncbi:hypothetical protein [Streptomyces sp. MP131-18]|uniref:hypothetical protein n=1 Tax=Streptomyces sp. MP131-18 TaxID=1857892 RepID=UPI00097C5CD9|nr:hypothetical protein [Streptomyces sp. MP131-18]ONK13248.1 hypothetical protein STBA_40110 [Streptomyces sp. MP131-18]